MTSNSAVIPRQKDFDFSRLARPLPAWNPKRYYYGAIRRLFATIGQWSDGVALGERYGFDSGVMLDYVYRDRASGRNVIGAAIDRAFLNAPGWRGIRARGALLQKTLGAELARAHAVGRDVHLLDVACGGGRYDVEALARTPAPVASALLRDYREENIASAEALARELNVAAQFERADAFSDADLARVAPKPNLIIVSGLHEIIDDDALVESHFRQLAAIAARPATLVFTIQPRHPQVEFIARVLKSHTGKPWVMRLRHWETTKAWAENAGFAVRCAKMEKQGIFGVVTADLT